MVGVVDLLVVVVVHACELIWLDGVESTEETWRVQAAVDVVAAAAAVDEVGLSPPREVLALESSWFVRSWFLSLLG